jgi:hypothetical protein
MLLCIASLSALLSGIFPSPGHSQPIDYNSRENANGDLSLAVDPATIAPRKFIACLFVDSEKNEHDLGRLVCEDETMSIYLELIFTNDASESDILGAISIANQALSIPHEGRFAGVLNTGYGASNGQVVWGLNHPLNDAFLTGANDLDCTLRYDPDLSLCPDAMRACIRSYGYGVCQAVFDTFPATMQNAKMVSGILLDFSRQCSGFSYAPNRGMPKGQCAAFWKITGMWMSSRGVAFRGPDGENALQPNGQLNRAWRRYQRADRADAIIRWIDDNVRSTKSYAATSWFDGPFCRSKLTAEQCIKLSEIARSDPDKAAVLARKWMDE